jgi:hypothetical protein|eukprot:CAMPEP_0174286404 /NCGR_PEP_ID=MMETSP0809-20121228/11754_1 /TAXON_ID=73025 ORGANISM="Eutreptiella gymnastica-like, Strain CCMP1594" /NCGR_SAMPLE_ID=MMETSP0809 /ASSEMBLY_ACC=CAM_ASM_000658 /LENGTH=102 /DNA_ID=CAMNT_0015382459 /DNA_START=16 /DNA_END=324 /DNA_ORIENTATION=-
MAEPKPVTGEMEVWDCRVSSGSCSGIFWRKNPFTGNGDSGNDWPRNGALLKGVVYEKDGEKHLKVAEIQQAGTSGFVPVNGEKWMPFEGGSNGGTWLHVPKQ